MSYPKKGDIYKRQGYDKPSEFFLLLEKNQNDAAAFNALRLNDGAYLSIRPHTAIWTRVA